MSNKKKVYLLKGSNIVKPKKFIPDPVSRNGIPDYADTRKNPKVENTQGWMDWWEEQIRRCLQGYWTAGIFIPGDYYFFLNFSKIRTPGKSYHNPMFVDSQYEFFLLKRYAREHNKGIIVIKARRKGLSEMVAHGEFDYGMRFKEGYSGGVVSGFEEYSTDFFEKYTGSEQNMPPELNVNYLTEANDFQQTGYKIKTNYGFKEGGWKNKIYAKTAYRNAKVFEGKELDAAVFEESGVFPLLDECYSSTKPCFMVGEEMVGLPFVYGTGSNIKKNGKAFNEMWNNSDAFDLLRYWVPGNKMYFPYVSGFSDKNENLKEKVPNLKKQYPEPYKRYGMEDLDAAKDSILKERVVKSKLADKKPYYRHLQNLPLWLKEAWMKYSDNEYDSKSLSDRRNDLLSETPTVYYVLEFEKQANGEYVKPFKVKARPAELDVTKPNHDDINDCIEISSEGMPRTDIYDLDVVGIDSYDQDQSKHTKSLGAIVVYRRGNKYTKGNYPVAVYCGRPDRKESFYMLAFKVSVFYGAYHNTMIDAERPLIIDHYKKVGGQNFLAQRPKSLESEWSKQTHDYGVKFTLTQKGGGSRPQLEGMIQSDIKDNIHKWEHVNLIEDCIGYESMNLDTDADIHDALACCHARIADMRLEPKKYNDGVSEEENPFSLNRIKEGEMGDENNDSNKEHWDVINRINEGHSI